MTRSFIAEVVIDHPDLPLKPTICAVPEARVRIESQPSQRESPSLFYSMTNSDFHRFESALADDPTVGDWRISMELSDCRIYRIDPSAKAKFTTPKIAELGIRVLSIQNTDRSWYFQLQAPDREALSAYWQYCRDEGVEFHLEKLYSSEPGGTTADGERLRAQFTDRQLEVARTAARMGYYDQDGASAEEVAEALGISPSTLSTHLRRIMEKVFWYLFENE